MKLRFKGHNYNTHFKSAIKTRFDKYFGEYKYPVNMWVSHGDDCCQYWTTDPHEMMQAFLDDPDFDVTIKRGNPNGK